MLSANHLAALAAHGAGFALEAKMFHPDELVQIARAGKGRLVIRDSKRLSIEDMIRIADARPELVFFEGL
jgi:hypothetical protein